MAAVAAAMGKPLMPHQRLMVDVGLEVQSEAAGDPEPGVWAYDDVTGTMQRRAGKTTIQAPVAAHRAERIHQAHGRPASMWMTAQTRDKAVQRLEEVAASFRRTVLEPEVRHKVAQGFEELRWVRSGATLRPFAPKEGALDGETPDLVNLDEIWKLTVTQARGILASYVPSFATRPGQTWKLSTMGTAQSHWMNGLRRAGRKAVQDDVRLGRAYFEFSLPRIIDGRRLKELSDEEVIAACAAHHPAVCHVPECRGAGERPCPHGFTVRPSYFASAWSQLDELEGDTRSEFLRGFGNLSVEDQAMAWLAMDELLFRQRIAEHPIPETVRVALGVAVDRESEDAAVIAAWRGADGVMHTEVIEHGEGTQWVPAYVAGVVGRQRPYVVGCAQVGPARDVADAMRALGVPVLGIAQADVAAACARHADQLKAEMWVHQHHDAAYTAAGSAVHVGKSREWQRDETPVSAWLGQALAGWAYDHRPADEKPPTRFWMG